MKYMITWEVREHVDENGKRVLERENERRIKGETWTKDDYVLSTHFILSEGKGLQIVDTTEAKLAKWIKVYHKVYKIKVSIIMHSDEWEKATK